MTLGVRREDVAVEILCRGRQLTARSVEDGCDRQKMSVRVRVFGRMPGRGAAKGHGRKLLC